MSAISPDRLLTETFLQHVCWLEQTHSTNSVAMELATSNLPCPALIGAEQQTRGRGRNRHTWWTASGALTFSLLLSPKQFNISPQHWPLLSMATGLAVCRTLEAESCISQTQIKWPNDVYLQGRKICGILLETVPENPELLVVGIGINVNNSLTTAPSELQQTAISLRDFADRLFDRTELLLRCVQMFAEELQSLSQDSSQLIRGCRQRCYLTGRLLTVRDVVTHLTGMCLGIDDDGALRIMTESGPRRLFTGEITRID